MGRPGDGCGPSYPPDWPLRPDGTPDYARLNMDRNPHYGAGGGGPDDDVAAALAAAGDDVGAGDDVAAAEPAAEPVVGGDNDVVPLGDRAMKVSVVLGLGDFEQIRIAASLIGKTAADVLRDGGIARAYQIIAGTIRE